MNAPLAVAASSAAAVIFWAIAADAAARRDLAIGTLPALLPALVGGATMLACIGGAPCAAVFALSGTAVAGWVDARTGSIFDPLTVALLGGAVVLSFVQGTAVAGALGTAAVGGALLLLHTVTDGRGIGFGDVKLGAALGMALGVSLGLVAMGVAFVLGAAYGIVLVLTKRAAGNTPVRFAPFIAAGTFIAVLFPPTLLPPAVLP